MKTLFVVLLLTSGILLVSSATKVIELSDRFMELRGDSTWIIMFYAPWCGHCKKLEPVWNHVAQTLYNTEIRSGRVDCTRFTSLSTHFRIKGFPTIMFIKGNTQEVFRGDRTKEEILGFALRMASAPVPHLDITHLEYRLKEHDLMFLYAGNKEDELWESYHSQALDFRHFHYFFSVDTDCLEKVTTLDSKPSVMVHKDDTFIYYPVPDSETYRNVTALNLSLSRWINNERFPMFMKITHGNMPQIWKVNKFLALVVVSEDKIGGLKGDAAEEEEEEEQKDARVDAHLFKDQMKAMILAKRSKYDAHFQFGWTGTPDIVNSIAMERLRLPCFVVVDTVTMNFFLPEGPSRNLDSDSLERFLDSVLSQSAPALGGDSYPLRLYRMYYNAKTSLEDMWSGNPVLTAVLFGLPFGFLSLICYSVWCSDILDADEDEEDPVPNENVDEGDKDRENAHANGEREDAQANQERENAQANQERENAPANQEKENAHAKEE